MLVPATAGSQTFGTGRAPQKPPHEREDAGWMSLYQGNWRGKRKKQHLSNHIVNDVTQEVDEETQQVVREVINTES